MITIVTTTDWIMLAIGMVSLFCAGFVLGGRIGFLCGEKKRFQVRRIEVDRSRYEVHGAGYKD